MYIVLGANGHVGSATAKALLGKGYEVLVVLHSEKAQAQWQKQGALVAVADLNDTAALKQIFSSGERAFVLNPPAPPSADTVQQETASANSILEALSGTKLEKLVVQSTYGAQPGSGIGDLGVLYGLEQGLAKLHIPSIIVRGAYYMSNWDMAVATARKEGIVHTLYPVDFKLPMVAPDDLGLFAAKFLAQPAHTTSIRDVEGPQEYSSADVAAALAKFLGREVKAVTTPPEQWVPSLTAAGFSAPAANAMAAMTRLTLESRHKLSGPVHRGQTTLSDYFSKIVSKD